MSNIAVIGSLLVDISIRTPRIPGRGDNLRGHNLRMGAGGKGANAATAIVRLGGQALAVGCLGDDVLGRYQLGAMQAEGIDTTGIKLNPDSPTSVAFVMVDDGGENTVLVANQTNLLLSACDVRRALLPHWGSLDALLVNFEASEEAVQFAVDQGNTHGIPVVVDAGPIMGYPPAVWRNATVLSPNASEASALAGFPVSGKSSALEAAQKLLKGGPKAIVVKLGSNGALLVSAGQELHIPALPVTVVDTIGAGDAFTAALTLALAEGQPVERAVRFAAAAGAVSTTRYGSSASMPTRDEVEKLLGSGV